MKEIIIKAVSSFSVTAFCTFIVGFVGKIHKKQKATEEGLQALLRAEIIRTYEKSLDRGFCPIYSKEAFSKCYDSYKELKGNGVIDSIFEMTMALPTEKEKKHGTDH